MTYIRCPHCGAKALNVATMCPQCRAPLSQNPMEAGPHGLLACPRCRKLIERDSEVCPFCAYHVRRNRVLRRRLLIGLTVVLVAGGAGFGLLQAGGLGGVVEWFAAAPTPGVTSATPEPRDTTPDPLPAEPTDTAVAPPIEAAVPDIEAPAVTPAPTPPPGRVLRYVLTWANVRAGRNTDSAVVTVLRPGEAIEVATPVGGWWAVWRNGALLGYVAADLIGTAPPDTTVS